MSGPSGSSSTGVNFKIISNKRGKTLLHAGHSYVFHRKNINSTVWVCVNKRKSKCSGAIKIVHENDTIHFINKHLAHCVPNFFENDIKCMLEKTKDEICSNFDSVQKIYEMNVMKMKTEMEKKQENYGPIAVIPDYHTVKTQLYTSRNKKLNVPKTQFRHPNQVVIPEVFKQHLSVDCIEDTNRILVFASKAINSHINRVQHYFGDGTFDCCAKPFVQIYTIQGDIGSDVNASNIVPLFYVLLANKETRTYETMFAKIKEAHPGFNPTKFTVDFETAAMNAIKKVFPDIIVQGCFVHFQRCIFRKAKSLGLLDHEETKQHVKLCISLAFLPKEDIEDGWLAIMENR